ncbi:hypothetical protein PF002_g6582 [Phytophthora fragariae]|uniref:Heparan-alpha-glucosaminide N-acetyltransferase catalytic domain-containing protein n=1 Tax=Phytophthora fragariae TaxID=53985 RepID=A0A6A3UJJ7_9STRA|nr:hypothetical protein PF011_g2922 [Phytophthora fragariae]KAE9150843.1 hypothetical protein PF006_g4804 [Phytophthora fragariae]KAE9246793.1 hypothetical protein PF002_g6582 [Phytophthora fragariae]
MLIETQGAIDVSSGLPASSSTSERVIVIGTLVCVLAALLRRSFVLLPGVDRSSRRSSSLTEPLVPARLKADAELYQLLERHKNAQNALRCQSLDAFRGLTLCLMVFVNYGGGGFAVFTHSVWDGLTVADLVFPWFAWILGFSVFLSSCSRRDESTVQTFVGIGQRTAKLFVLGLFINNGDSWSDWRIPGVLQALSAAYMVVAVADWGLSRRSGRSYKQQHVSKFVGWHVVFGVIPLVLINLLLTFKLPVPGCPTGYIGPGGLADDGAYQNCTGGAHLYVDSLVFGQHHLFQTPTCQKRYQTGPYDPEGLLNWLMVATAAYIGYLQASSCSALGAEGSGSSPAGPGFHSTRTCGRYPSLKWPGVACVAVGRNSIAIYVMHEVCQHFAPFAPKPVEGGEEIPRLEFLLYNLVGVVTWVVVAQWMDRNEIYIKI